MTHYNFNTYHVAVSSAILNITESVSELCLLLDQISPSFAICYKYPELTLEEERANRLSGNQVSRSIPVERIDDSFSAFIEIKRAFKDFYSHENMSSKSTYRLPGFMVINDIKSFDLIQNCVEKVNFYKQVFADLIKVANNDISSNFDKEEYFISYHKHLVKLQVARKIKCFELKANFSVGFHWTDKSLSNVCTKNQLISKIEQQIENLESDKLLSSKSESKLHYLKATLERVNELPDGVALRERRPIQTQPSVNIGLLRTNDISKERLAELKKEDTFSANSTCPLPFIILSSHKMKKTVHLTDYSPKDFDPTSGGKYKSVLPNMNIYQKI